MIALLTTDTNHHIFFENEIFKKYKNIINICEKDSIKPKFKTNIFFEKKRDLFEKKICFQNSKIGFRSKSYIVNNINETRVVNILKKNKIKYVFVFGTRKIEKKIINKYKNRIFNLHGGNPEEFRGLDSHYWSIYHNNFDLHCCLHKLNYKLDDGDIVFIKKLNLKKKIKIHQLRLENTYCCVQIVLKLLNLINRKKNIPFYRQKKIGRYYSFMPRELKKIIEKKFIRKFK